MRLRPPTLLFLGWFGPRGLASIVFALVVVEGSSLAGRERVLAAVVVAVLLSVVLHGLTAFPGAAWYGRRMAALVRQDADPEEHAPVSELPVRLPTTG